MHRDIKPSNLLLDRTGKVWVADFGLAKNENQDLTTTGNIVGTLRFMSPERLDGNNDRRSDIYSLGMTLYELLSLRPAFQHTNQLKVLEKVRDQNPARLNTIDSGIPVDLQTIVEKAIEKDPRKRYSTAGAMAEDLQLFLQGRPIKARRSTQLEHVVSWARRNPGIAASLASIVVLVLAGLIGTSIAAWQFRNMAIQQEHLAGVAEKESNENQQNLYYAEMKLAVEAADSPYAKRPLQELLGHWNPKNPDEIDRRGFEWYWLNSLLHPNIKKLDDYTWERVSFTPNGKQLCQSSANEIALASWPNLEDTWTRFSNQNSRFFEKAKLETNSSRIAFISNKEFLANDPSEMILEVWDWEQDKKLFEVREGGPLNFAWSHDGTRLAVLMPTELPNTKECSIRIYSTDTWELVRDLELPHITNRFDRPISFSCDGRWLAVAVENKNRIDHENGWILGRYGVVCYDTSNWKIERSYFGKKWSLVSGLEWHPTKSELAIRSLNGSIFRWVVDNDASREAELENFMQTISWDDGGKQVVVAGDGSVRSFDTAMKPFRHWLVSDSHSIFARPHPRTDEIVVVVDDENSPMDGTSIISQVHYPKQIIAGPAIKHIEATRWPAKLNWRPDGKQLASSLDTSTTIWDAVTGKPAYIISEHVACSIVGHCFGWNARNQILATYDGVVSCYSANGEAKDKSFAKRFGESDVNRDGSEFYYIQKNKSTWQLSRLNLDSQIETAVITLPNEKFSFYGQLSPDDQFFAFGIGKKLVIVDLNAKKIQTEINLENAIKGAAWSSDGTTLACSCEGGEIAVLNMETLETVAKYKGHTGEILALDWAPDGNRLASAGWDKTVHLWDPATGKIVVILKQDAGVNAVAWSPNGQRLATINLNGETTIYDATLGYKADEQHSD
ncbi:MAG: WD40 repeat domain-containing serine/threonine-protein kinase [Planctomycetota bacterium]